MIQKYIKRLTAVFLFAVCLNVFIPLVSFSDDDKNKIRLTTGPWMPFTGEDLPHYGSAARIVQEAFAIQGIEVEFIFRPWKRAFLQAMNGSFDGSILWRHTPEREKNFYISDPVLTVDIVFFHLKSYPFDWNSINELKQNKILIGFVRGLKYEDEFDTAIKNGGLSAESVTTQAQNLKKILLGRIQITPIIIESGYATINAKFPPEEAKLFTHHTRPLARQTLHLLLSKKVSENHKMLVRFNEGLKRLNQTDN